MHATDLFLIKLANSLDILCKIGVSVGKFASTNWIPRFFFDYLPRGHSCLCLFGRIGGIYKYVHKNNVKITEHS